MLSEAILPWWWRWAALATLCVASGGTGYVKGLDHNADKIAALQGQIAAAKAIGEQASKRTEAINNQTTEIKKDADHENETATHDTFARVKRMRDALAGGSFVPIVPSGSRRPDLICFDKAEYQRTDGEFTDGARELSDEGTQATIDLNTAKEWVLRLKMGEAMITRQPG